MNTAKNIIVVSLPALLTKQIHTYGSGNKKSRKMQDKQEPAKC